MLRALYIRSRRNACDEQRRLFRRPRDRDAKLAFGTGDSQYPQGQHRQGVRAQCRCAGDGHATCVQRTREGTVDIHPEVWQPNLEDVIKRFVTEKGVVVLAKRGVPAWQGICATPAAAEKGLKTIADLSDPEKTKILDTDGDGKGEMWLGAPTWSSTGIERVRANTYGYAKNLTLVESEEEVAMAGLDIAIATNQPLVFACYAPHFIFDLHKIVRLAEPPHDASKWKLVGPNDPLWITKSSASTAWDTANFRIGYAAAFEKKHPDIAAFLEKVDLSPEEATAMGYALEVERIPPLDYATKWVADNAKRVDGWAKK
ncbi:MULTISPECIES: glycine betaine ABC transporter substrate-binding protein [Rhizobium]|uniref:glycine betaine ABC transporter substrate-binding protein n=1 Tax=Rhizobium TaxID=379 RepID=UPI0009EBC32A|nr:MULTISPECIES: glycine betaine ABC transporter substrate-binding protein [Rhizobium]MCS0458881.1 amino acid-binding protein [Rhizobium favelukesii]UFS83007.1 amino acid-binding protein [Rhizobium sp. T136]